MNESENTFRDYILEKISLAGLNYEEFAALIGVSKGTISRWINNQVVPDYESMKKVSKGLNAPIQEVIDAIEGRYKPLSKVEREAIEISKKYSLEALKEAYMISLDDKILDIPCPKCSEKVSVRIGDAKADDYRANCNACGLSFPVDTSKLQSGLDDLNNSLKKAFGGRKKTFKIDI